ncbi:PREDICTED: uncharacterized protein LOC108765514 [Trachymyrmex cornetzi]|uniref:uncharacterized protein LOC108765514 n=1 Tax=Trachymyrmex cornetzi TaxID=471704 RepID=UPI00084EFE3F|nr:PREDICTED: uncharacterized protein LOC108765514 [Trachymyrmex cornetzi]
MERIRRLERRSEWREREERKRNIIVKGLNVEREIEGKIEELIGSIEVGVGVEKIRKIKAGRQEKGWMVMVMLGSVENKGKIIRNKWKLKGRDIWIEEDLTWKERKMRWMMRHVVMKEG